MRWQVLDIDRSLLKINIASRAAILPLVLRCTLDVRDGSFAVSRAAAKACSVVGAEAVHHRFDVRPDWSCCTS
jgi:hypothetical protein